MEEFIQRILETLTTNGFPAKRVTLPTEKMYEAADRRGLSFNTVLELLKRHHQIEAAIGPDKIVFSRTLEKTSDKADTIRQAQEMMAKMDPAELKRVQEMFENMSPE